MLCLLLSGSMIWLHDAAYSQLADTTGVDLGFRGSPRIQKTDARSAALAGATVADIYSNSSVNSNPALISLVKRPNSIQYHNYKNWSNNVVQQSAVLPAIRISNHTIVLQGTMMYDGNNWGNLTGEHTLPVPDLQVFEAGVAYAYRLAGSLSVGVLNTTSYGQSNESEFWANHSTIGLLYAPEFNVTYGAALRGLGTSIIYELDPRGNTLLQTQTVRTVLEIGATLKFPVESDDPFLAISFSNEKQFGVKGIWYKGGIELKPIPFFAMRSGILFEPDQGILLPRYGLGVDANFFRADYSISPRQFQAERFHQISITLQF